MAQFDIQDVTFAYPGAHTEALVDIDLSIQAGEYLCIYGKSGCGKTTLVRQLKSVLVPGGERFGSVWFNGVALDDVSSYDQSRLIGFVMQDPDAQIVTDKVWHELAFGLENLGTDRQTMRVRVAEMASYFGIQSWFHKDVAELSGGQKQLLNLASVMAMQPQVLILDEPTAQLDPIAAADLLNTVRRINTELGTTIIMTEHRLEEVFAAADTVVVMEQGRITAKGSPEHVASALYDESSEMTFALPSAARIFHGVEGASPAACSVSAHFDSVCSKAPLTVREGRQWLLEYANTHSLPIRSLPDDSAGEDDLIGDDAPDKDVPDPVIRLKDVWFRYEKDAPDVLRGVSLDVPRGSIYALVGGNGTGKSTMLKAICGVCKPYRGKISVLGKPLKEWKKQELFHGGIALLPQDPQNLFATKCVRDDLSEMLFMAKGRNTSAECREGCADRIDEVARLCAIEDLFDRHPFDLSGGELQRAALAKVLLCDPQVVLLDEPTKGIDTFFKRKLAQILQELTERGVTVLLVSHDVEFCARCATRVSMFFDGSIISTNTPRRFFAANALYTTAAHRMSRQVFTNAVTDEDVIDLCLR